MSKDRLIQLKQDAKAILALRPKSTWTAAERRTVEEYNAAPKSGWGLLSMIGTASKKAEAPKAKKLTKQERIVNCLLELNVYEVLQTAVVAENPSLLQYKTIWLTPEGAVMLDTTGPKFRTAAQFNDYKKQKKFYRPVAVVAVLKNWAKHDLYASRVIETKMLKAWL